MNPLDIDEINKLSPYKVNKDPITGYLYFVTKNGIQLVIDFIDDDLIHSADMRNRRRKTRGPKPLICILV